MVLETRSSKVERVKEWSQLEICLHLQLSPTVDDIVQVLLTKMRIGSFNFLKSLNTVKLQMRLAGINVFRQFLLAVKVIF